MKVRNLINDRHNAAANQFVIENYGCTYFQSYDSVVAKIDNNRRVTLGMNWNFSNTTRKHLYIFLRDYTRFNVHSKKEVLKLMKDKEIYYDEKMI